MSKNFWGYHKFPEKLISLAYVVLISPKVRSLQHHLCRSTDRKCFFRSGTCKLQYHRQNITRFQASSRIKRGTTFIAISYVRTYKMHEKGMASISDVLRRLTSSSYLLEKQFCRVRNGKLSHILGAFAIGTPTPVSQEAAGLACIYFEFIRRDHQTFKQKLGCAIADETVAFHFAKA